MSHGYEDPGTCLSWIETHREVRGKEVEEDVGTRVDSSVDYSTSFTGRGYCFFSTSTASTSACSFALHFTTLFALRKGPCLAATQSVSLLLLLPASFVYVCFASPCLYPHYQCS